MLRNRRQEDHADDADLLLDGVECRVGLVGQDPLIGLGVHDLPLGRGVQGLEQATLRRLHVVLKARVVAAGHEVLEVPLDRVPLGTRVVFAQRDERDRKGVPDVLAARQVRAHPVVVLVGDVEGHRLRRRRRGDGGFSLRLRQGRSIDRDQVSPLRAALHGAVRGVVREDLGDVLGDGVKVGGHGIQECLGQGGGKEVRKGKE